MSAASVFSVRKSKGVRFLWYFNYFNNFFFFFGVAQWYIAGLRAGLLGVRAPAVAGNYSLYHLVQTGSGAHPASYPMGKRSSFSLEVNWAGREADHSPPSSTEIKNAWNSTPPVRLHSVVLS
jgi:hypothetical protein